MTFRFSVNFVPDLSKLTEKRKVIFVPDLSKLTEKRKGGMPGRARQGAGAAAGSGLEALSRAALVAKAREQGLQVSGNKAELIKRLEEARVAATLYGRMESAVLARDSWWNFNQALAARGVAPIFPQRANDWVGGVRFERIEDELARCRANLWREAAAMGAHSRLSQRDGVGARPSPFAELERGVLDMVLKYVEAPYLPPVPRTVVPII